jgi:hypothetical protein
MSSRPNRYWYPTGIFRHAFAESGNLQSGSSIAIDAARVEIVGRAPRSCADSSPNIVRFPCAIGRRPAIARSNVVLPDPFNTNYGLYFTSWGKWMGTEHPRYHEKFRDVTGRARQVEAQGRVEVKA